MFLTQFYDAQKISHIFRNTDIRGIYGKDITPEIALDIGKAFGTILGEGKTIIVARDNRKGSVELRDAIVEGLNSVGVNVLDVGVVPVPVLYFLVAHKKLSGGAMITASHNPPEWNGFKLVLENAMLITAAYRLDELKEIFFNRKFSQTANKGNHEIREDLVQEYLEYVISKVNVNRKMKVIVDPCNGSASEFAKKLYESIGCDVIMINDDMSKPPARNFVPIDENLFALKDAVIKNNADIGIAFDGDADRVGFIDDKGRFFGTGNATIMVFADDYLQKSKGKVVIDVCCSSAVEEFIKENGGTPLLNRVGHGFMVNRMIEENAIFGGEISNHLYFPEVYGLDDGLFAGLKMLDIMSKKNMTLSQIYDSIKRYPSTDIHEIPCSDTIKFSIVEKIKDKFKGMGFNIVDIDGVKACGSSGWVLVRASNTLPQIKINAEGRTYEDAKKLHEMAVNSVMEEIGRHENIAD